MARPLVPLPFPFPPLWPTGVCHVSIRGWVRGARRGRVGAGASPVGAAGAASQSRSMAVHGRRHGGRTSLRALRPGREDDPTPVQPAQPLAVGALAEPVEERRQRQSRAAAGHAARLRAAPHRRPHTAALVQHQPVDPRCDRHVVVILMRPPFFFQTFFFPQLE